AFNATSNDDVQGADLVDLPYDDFIRPVIKAVTAQFVIGTTVGAQMKSRGSGVILVMAGGREAIPALGGSHVAWCALAGLCRQRAQPARRTGSMAALAGLARLIRPRLRVARHPATTTALPRRRRQRRRLPVVRLGQHDDSDRSEPHRRRSRRLTALATATGRI